MIVHNAVAVLVTFAFIAAMLWASPKIIARFETHGVAVVDHTKSDEARGTRC